MLPAFFSLKKVTAKMPVSNISTDMEELLLQVCKIIKKSRNSRYKPAKHFTPCPKSTCMAEYLLMKPHHFMEFIVLLQEIKNI